MRQTLDITRTSRTIVSQMLAGHTLDQLNTIPEGYNNNLIWNIAHIIVVQQMLVYKLSGLPMMISDEMVEKYKKGTKP
ncbi:MAG: DinB family protein, partial [Flavobacterium sp.]